MLVAHKPIQDPVIMAAIADHLQTLNTDILDLERWDSQTHINIFDQWLKTGKHVKINGLDKFKHRALCNGSSAALSHFVYRNNHKRIRFSRNEFVLGRVVSNDGNIDWAYLEDDKIKSTDAVMVSVPFAGNGGQLPNYQQLIHTCNQLDVPVCVDLAYAGIGIDIQIDVDEKCIQEVVSSISKPFSSMLRHGIRYSKQRHDDNIQIASDTGILPRINIAIASKLLENFSKDFIVDKYINRYHKVCADLGLTETNTVTLALGDPDKHKEFVRGDQIRICITDELLS